MIAVYAISVQGLDRLIGFRIAGHLYKSVALGYSGKSVLDQLCAFDFSEFGKQCLQAIFRGAER